MKTNEIKPIERALNKKSEVSVVDIANEIGDLVGGWHKDYYPSFTDFVEEYIRNLDLDRKHVKNLLIICTAVAFIIMV